MNWLSLSVVVGSLTICGGLVTPAAPRQFCDTRIKYYTRVLKIPQEVCMPAFQQYQKLPAGNVVGKVQSWPEVITRPSYSLLRKDKTTAQQVIGMFPGVFLNTTTAKELGSKLRKEILIPRPGVIKTVIPGEPENLPSVIGPAKGLKGTVSHDGDLHCPTFRNLNQAPDFMKNVRDEMNEIVHFPTEGVYQYIHNGTCGSSDTQSCSGGGCFQEKMILYLMVWKDSPDWPTGFEPFEVESYCSCKGITL